MSADGVKAWLLDLDGTLVNTHSANVAAYMDAIPYAIPRARIEEGELRCRIEAGESCANFVPALVTDATASEIALVAARKADVYPSFLGLSTLNDVLVDEVRSWRKDGGAAVLVTTAKRPNAEAVLLHHDITDLFDLKVFGDGIERLKPAPDIYLLAMRLAGLASDECLAFEDSDAGVEAARAAGVEVVRIEWGHGYNG
ncbi:MAG: HAD family phosphatase [Atopobiaceae bacterium]|nr:HAD family phosphatase [Atopobiaceae bacterium]